MGTVRPGTVTVAGVSVPVAGGPWTVGEPVVRAASAVLYSPQSAHARVSGVWVPLASRPS